MSIQPIRILEIYLNQQLTILITNAEFAVENFLPRKTKEIMFFYITIAVYRSRSAAAGEQQIWTSYVEIKFWNFPSILNNIETSIIFLLAISCQGF